MDEKLFKRISGKFKRVLDYGRKGRVPTWPDLGGGSVDNRPWQHPFLTVENISRFRKYSEEVWQFASDYAETKRGQSLDCAFAVNMAQNMYKWARLSKVYGATSCLYLHDHDRNAISSPQWEEYDGEFSPLADFQDLIAALDNINPEVPTYRIPLKSNQFCQALSDAHGGNQKPLLRLLSQSGGVKYEALVSYREFMPYFDWVKAIASHEVIYAASTPFVAYASGRPYCVFSVGGDLQFDCGRTDVYGHVMLLAFNAARFMMVSNPHTLGHSRRLGLTNGIYMPYPMDTSRYKPGIGRAREEWVAKYGKGVYILTTARVDANVKGHSDEFIATLIDVAKNRTDAKFVFLSWGDSALKLQQLIAAEGMQDQFIVLPTVGKKRLIDYYRSCDLVLDQFVYGYYGATALEAAAVGKPVIMKMRDEQYAPLYSGDIAPVNNARNFSEIRNVILDLIDNEDLRNRRGDAMRSWVVRNHGEEKTVPLLLALLRLAADRVQLPSGLKNPLSDEMTAEEKYYHQSCLQM
ncbi:MAG: glycosyltransferase [Rhodospirillales bacterium]|nr:glycosyltransferase [Rhodospirillales bacterium]